MKEVLLATLMYGALPLWIAAGLADWWCHRSTGIERTSGVGESALHFVLFAQMGIAGMAALLLEVNSLVLVAASLLFCLHEATTWVELRFVSPLRYITPTEQMVHSVMEMVPLAALAMLAALHADGLIRFFAFAPADWQLRLKAEPLPSAYLVAAIGGVFLLNLLPLLEEGWRCLRFRSGRQAV